MSDKISRRALFGLNEPEGAAKAAERDGAAPAEAFSLAGFYAKRAPGPPGAAIPTFEVRAPASPVPTTRVGVTRAARPPWELSRGRRAEGAPRLGGPVAVVRSACLAWQGSPCWTCSERCPVEGAITLDAGKPTVDVERCDGCGECVAACPAPHNALKLAAHVHPQAAERGDATDATDTTDATEPT